MPTRQEWHQNAISLFETARYPEGLSAQSAWLGIYQVLLWYERIPLLTPSQVPHIIEANVLNPRRPTGQSINAWQKRAIDMNSFLAEQLQCTDEEVYDKMDLLLRQPEFVNHQRQNPLGIAFAGLLQHVLSKFGKSDLEYETEAPATSVYPGIQLPGRSTGAAIDVLIRNYIGRPVVLISAKWSARHDRISDITNECPIYRNAHNMQYRQRNDQALRFYVATNEFNPGRLEKLLSDPCIDGVVHVCKRAVTEVCGLNGRMTKLMDLSDLIAATNSF